MYNQPEMMFILLAHIYIEDYMTFFFEKQLSKVRMNIFLK